MIRDTYTNQLAEMRPTLEHIATFTEETSAAWTAAELEHYEGVVKRYEQVLNIVHAIDDTVKLVQREQTQYGTIPDVTPEPSAQKSDTLELMNEVARHLSGRDVEVRIEQPENYGVAGLCIWGAPDSKHAIKIQINPRTVEDGALYLKVFLHEVAHAKLHDGFVLDDEHAAKMEREAIGQAVYWQHFARTHSAPFESMPDVGGVSAPANYFRLQLLTLLRSDEAARRTVA